MTTASTTGKYINPTPTHSPTETVSDCSNCGEDMGSSLWASIQDGNPKHLHMCGKCVVSLDNPQEPTVEKWEDSKTDYGQSFTLGLNKDNTEMITITPKSSETSQVSMSLRQLHRILSQARSQSVQEAKAEMIDDFKMRFVDGYDRLYKETGGNIRHELELWCEYVLSTLNTKEEV